MTNPLTTLVPEHQLVTSSISGQGNRIENVAQCTCGSVDLDWYERELQHARHVLDVVRAEERARCVILIRQKYGVTNRAADWLARQEVQ